uniref:hypothetical chloroplast RF4 n=1 Tax=Gormaniella terricola TaxID=2904618 RepID=UPI0021CC61CE|nr:hypothetical chloroplast RF4 [Gormaniella terricola]UWV18269.1 hypothetical chloroplast RF4 [Gormaniella terricola]
MNSKHCLEIRLFFCFLISKLKEFFEFMNTLRDNDLDLVRRYVILGSRRLSNYWWATVLFLGASGFLLTGVSSYLGYNILPFIKSGEISFLPQGLVMSFYGVLGVLLSFYLWLTILWDVGGGFNEFNKKDGKIRVFRWGFPGKSRCIDVSYSISDVEAIRVELKQGVNPERTIFLRVKGKREIPLTQIGQPLTLEEIEKRAAELAKFLKVSVEGL